MGNNQLNSMDNIGEIKVLCLMIFGRSGSKFFQGLVDGHPQIISFPRNLAFNMYWQKVETRKEDIEYVTNMFIEEHPRIFSGATWCLFNKYDRADELGPNRNETFTVDIDLFRKKAIERLRLKPVTRKNAFVAFHLAYHETCGKPILKNSIIFCHIHSMVFLDELRACIEDFPDTHLLVRTRQPIERLNSCATWMKMQNVFSCGQPFEEQVENLYGTERITRLFPDLDVRVITFEQLHWHHRETMKEFADWMGINWDESLMTSTIHGKLWWGDSNVLRHGSNQKWKLYEPKGFLEKNDYRILMELNGERMKRFGYAPEETGNARRLGRATLFALLLLPTKYEWIVFKTMLNPRQWLETIHTIIKDVASEKRKDFDFYTKKHIVRQEGAFLGLSNAKLASGYRICQQIIWHIWLLNPIKWLWFYLKRIAYYYKYDEDHKTYKEKIPLVIAAGSRLYQEGCDCKRLETTICA